jgi:hypothetical protein
MGDAQGASYQFELAAGGAKILGGRAMVVLEPAA